MKTEKKSKLRVPRAVRQRLRNSAIAKVRQDMIHAGREESSYSEQELEKGFGVAALLLGINIGI